ncbi:hypothetical protein [Hyphomicrobium sp. D-2]|uniref:hypothetical protein n=1 Tax=Hyphomicrobium sp. D-2 TaxID=3041621 RepID=UPI002455E607|nr:hypothetical protein [Hyphomicrobium sp. D-2]MDH4983258.1 hypothetical protein [Hyphomicrobium sp. D-2]
MGLLQTLFGRRARESNDWRQATLNPLLRLKLEEFVLSGSGSRPRHYFRFIDDTGEASEFIVKYDQFGDQLIYSGTMYRQSGETDFSQLSEQAWSIPITHLMSQGRILATRVQPTRHFSSDV